MKLNVEQLWFFWSLTRLLRKPRFISAIYDSPSCSRMNCADSAPSVSKAPRYCYRWNGELQLDDELSPDADTRSTVLRAHRVCSTVLVKRLPAAVVDGASVDFNVVLSAAIENEQRLQSGMIVSRPHVCFC